MHNFRSTQFVCFFELCSILLKMLQPVYILLNIGLLLLTISAAYSNIIS